MRPCSSMPGRGGEFVEETCKGVRAAAVLAGFVRKLDLDQHGQPPAQGQSRGAQALAGLDFVQRVDGVEELDRAGCFVVLERADEMHLEPGQCGDHLGLALHLLHTVLAEVALPGGVGLLDTGGWVHLADGDEIDRVEGAIGPATRGGDLLANAVEVGCDAVGHG